MPLQIAKPSKEQDDWVCVLCKRAGSISASLGGFLRPFTWKGKSLIIHLACAIFCPESAGEINKEKILREINRGNRLLCAHCHRLGATMGCALPDCRKSFHLPCAATSGCAFDPLRHLSRLGGLFCPDHTDKPEAATAVQAESGKPADWSDMLSELKAEVSGNQELKLSLEQARATLATAAARANGFFGKWALGKSSEKLEAEKSRVLGLALDTQDCRGRRCTVCNSAFRAASLTSDINLPPAPPLDIALARTSPRAACAPHDGPLIPEGSTSARQLGHTCAMPAAQSRRVQTSLAYSSTIIHPASLYPLLEDHGQFMEKPVAPSFDCMGFHQRQNGAWNYAGSMMRQVIDNPGCFDGPHKSSGEARVPDRFQAVTSDDNDLWWLAGTALKCSKCTSVVHAGCYGVPLDVVSKLLRNIMEGRPCDWVCDVCKDGAQGVESCPLCPFGLRVPARDGATVAVAMRMASTNDVRVPVHLACALWQADQGPEKRGSQVRELGEFLDLRVPTLSSTGRPCAICSIDSGYTHPTHDPTSFDAPGVHIACAISNMLTVEHTAPLPHPERSFEGGITVYMRGDEPVATYCVCNEPYDRFMLMCDMCHEWYHGDCVGLNDNSLDDDEAYLCRSCTAIAEAGGMVDAAVVARNEAKSEPDYTPKPRCTGWKPLVDYDVPEERSAEKAIEEKPAEVGGKRKRGRPVKSSVYAYDDDAEAASTDDEQDQDDDGANSALSRLARGTTVLTPLLLQAARGWTAAVAKKISWPAYDAASESFTTSLDIDSVAEGLMAYYALSVPFGLTSKARNSLLSGGDVMDFACLSDAVYAFQAKWDIINFHIYKSKTALHKSSLTMPMDEIRAVAQSLTALAPETLLASAHTMHLHIEKFKSWLRFGCATSVADLEYAVALHGHLLHLLCNLSDAVERSFLVGDHDIFRSGGKLKAAYTKLHQSMRELPVEIPEHYFSWIAGIATLCGWLADLDAVLNPAGGCVDFYDLCRVLASAMGATEPGDPSDGDVSLASQLHEMQIRHSGACGLLLRNLGDAATTSSGRVIRFSERTGRPAIQKDGDKLLFWTAPLLDGGLPWTRTPFDPAATYAVPAFAPAAHPLTIFRDACMLLSSSDSCLAKLTDRLMNDSKADVAEIHQLLQQLRSMNVVSDEILWAEEQLSLAEIWTRDAEALLVSDTMALHSLEQAVATGIELPFQLPLLPRLIDIYERISWRERVNRAMTSSDTKPMLEEVTQLLNHAAADADTEYSTQVNVLRGWQSDSEHALKNVRAILLSMHERSIPDLNSFLVHASADKNVRHEMGTAAKHFIDEAESELRGVFEQLRSLPVLTAELGEVQFYLRMIAWAHHVDRDILLASEVTVADIQSAVSAQNCPEISRFTDMDGQETEVEDEEEGDKASKKLETKYTDHAPKRSTSESDSYNTGQPFRTTSLVYKSHARIRDAALPLLKLIGASSGVHRRKQAARMTPNPYVHLLRSLRSHHVSTSQMESEDEWQQHPAIMPILTAAIHQLCRRCSSLQQQGSVMLATMRAIREKAFSVDALDLKPLYQNADTDCMETRLGRLVDLDHIQTLLNESKAMGLQFPELDTIQPISEGAVSWVQRADNFCLHGNRFDVDVASLNGLLTECLHLGTASAKHLTELLHAAASLRLLASIKCALGRVAASLLQSGSIDAAIGATLDAQLDKAAAYMKDQRQDMTHSGDRSRWWQQRLEQALSFVAHLRACFDVASYWQSELTNQYHQLTPMVSEADLLLRDMPRALQHTIDVVALLVDIAHVLSHKPDASEKSLTTMENLVSEARLADARNVVYIVDDIEALVSGMNVVAPAIAQMHDEVNSAQKWVISSAALLSAAAGSVPSGTNSFHDLIKLQNAVLECCRHLAVRPKILPLELDTMRASTEYMVWYLIFGHIWKHRMNASDIPSGSDSQPARLIDGDAVVRALNGLIQRRDTLPEAFNTLVHSGEAEITSLLDELKNWDHLSTQLLHPTEDSSIEDISNELSSLLHNPLTQLVRFRTFEDLGLLLQAIQDWEARVERQIMSIQGTFEQATTSLAFANNELEAELLTCLAGLISCLIPVWQRSLQHVVREVIGDRNAIRLFSHPKLQAESLDRLQVSDLAILHHEVCPMPAASTFSTYVLRPGISSLRLAVGLLHKVDAILCARFTCGANLYDVDPARVFDASAADEESHLLALLQVIRPIPSLRSLQDMLAALNTFYPSNDTPLQAKLSKAEKRCVMWSSRAFAALQSSDDPASDLMQTLLNLQKEAVHGFKVQARASEVQDTDIMCEDDDMLCYIEAHIATVECKSQQRFMDADEKVEAKAAEEFCTMHAKATAPVVLSAWRKLRWVKYKGFPYWPAEVPEDQSAAPPGRLLVRFFGSHPAFVASNQAPLAVRKSQHKPWCGKPEKDIGPFPNAAVVTTAAFEDAVALAVQRSDKLLREVRKASHIPGSALSKNDTKIVVKLEPAKSDTGTLAVSHTRAHVAVPVLASSVLSQTNAPAKENRTIGTNEVAELPLDTNITNKKQKTESATDVASAPGTDIGALGRLKALLKWRSAPAEQEPISPLPQEPQAALPQRPVQTILPIPPAPVKQTSGTVQRKSAGVKLDDKATRMKSCDLITSSLIQGLRCSTVAKKISQVYGAEIEASLNARFPVQGMKSEYARVLRAMVPALKGSASFAWRLAILMKCLRAFEFVRSISTTESLHMETACAKEAGSAIRRVLYYAPSSLPLLKAVAPAVIGKIIEADASAKPKPAARPRSPIAEQLVISQAKRARVDEARPQASGDDVPMLPSASASLAELARDSSVNQVLNIALPSLGSVAAEPAMVKQPISLKSSGPASPLPPHKEPKAQLSAPKEHKEHKAKKEKRTIDLSSKPTSSKTARASTGDDGPVPATCTVVGGKDIEQTALIAKRVMAPAPSNKVRQPPQPPVLPDQLQQSGRMKIIDFLSHLKEVHEMSSSRLLALFALVPGLDGAFKHNVVTFTGDVCPTSSEAFTDLMRHLGSDNRVGVCRNTAMDYYVYIVPPAKMLADPALLAPEHKGKPTGAHLLKSHYGYLETPAIPLLGASGDPIDYANCAYAVLEYKPATYVHYETKELRQRATQSMSQPTPHDVEVLMDETANTCAMHGPSALEALISQIKSGAVTDSRLNFVLPSHPLHGTFLQKLRKITSAVAPSAHIPAPGSPARGVSHVKAQGDLARDPRLQARGLPSAFGKPDSAGSMVFAEGDPRRVQPPSAMQSPAVAAPVGFTAARPFAPPMAAPAALPVRPLGSHTAPRPPSDAPFDPRRAAAPLLSAHAESSQRQAVPPAARPLLARPLSAVAAPTGSPLVRPPSDVPVPTVPPLMRPPSDVPVPTGPPPVRPPSSAPMAGMPPRTMVDPRLAPPRPPPPPRGWGQFARGPQRS